MTTLASTMEDKSEDMNDDTEALERTLRRIEIVAQKEGERIDDAMLRATCALVEIQNWARDTLASVNANRQVQQRRRDRDVIDRLTHIEELHQEWAKQNRYRLANMGGR